MVNYKNKYLKYKKKYLQLNGGVNLEEDIKYYRSDDGKYIRAEIITESEGFVLDVYNIWNSQIVPNKKVLCYFDMARRSYNNLDEYQILNNFSFDAPVYMSRLQCVIPDLYKDYGKELLKKTINYFYLDEGCLIVEAETTFDGFHGLKLEHPKVEYFKSLGFSPVGIFTKEHAKNILEELREDNDPIPNGNEDEKIEELQYSTVLMAMPLKEKET
jgi:hypothetical protein